MPIYPSTQTCTGWNDATNTGSVHQRPQLNIHCNPTHWPSQVSLGRATAQVLSGSYMNLWPRYPYKTDVCRVGTLRLTNEEKTQVRIRNKLDYIYNLQSKIIKTLRAFGHGFGNHQWYRNAESTNLFPKFRTLKSKNRTYNSFFFLFFSFLNEFIWVTLMTYAGEQDVKCS